MKIKENDPFEEELKNLIQLWRNLNIGDHAASLLVEPIQRQIIYLFKKYRKVHFNFYSINNENPFSFIEMACLALFFIGKYRKEVASILSLSEHTIEGYEKQFRKKLKAVNRHEAIYRACAQDYLKFDFS